jgi:hypothetical protein
VADEHDFPPNIASTADSIDVVQQTSPPIFNLGIAAREHLSIVSKGENAGTREVDVFQPAEAICVGEGTKSIAGKSMNRDDIEIVIP